jgi:hypothetical protein
MRYYIELKNLKKRLINKGMIKRELMAFLLVILCIPASAQVTDSLGIQFQSVARNGSGNVLLNQNISLRFGIYQNTVGGQLLWQETHMVNTGSLGVYNVVIGTGTSTGAGTHAGFNLLDWSQGNKVILFETDVTGGTMYSVVDTLLLSAVPYAFHAASAHRLIVYPALHELTDVDTLGVQTDYTLKWNGSIWLPAPDEEGDTAAFAWNGQYAFFCDTAQYAYNLINAVDSALHSDYSDTAQFSFNSQQSAFSSVCNYADTAMVALNCTLSAAAWNKTGNAGTNPSTHFLGTTDNTDLVIKSNFVERMRITANGKIGIGTLSPLGSFDISTDEPVVFRPRTTAALPVSITGAGTRFFWYPGKKSFRAGQVTGTQFDDINIGNFSFATGYNAVARGNYSFAAGQSTNAYADYSTSLGFGNDANGLASFTAGSSNTANGPYSVAIGRGGLATDSASMAIGYHCNVTGKFALGFGFQNNASGDYSITMGYHASTGGQSGSFVFSDESNSTYTVSTAPNQFMVRASGGYYFYSDAALTTGVVLASGSGSWSSVSDINKKKNVRPVNGKTILEKLRSVPVYTWNYISQPDSIIHMGPTAQDFYKAFGLGESDTLISVVDIDGVNMAALKELEERTRKFEEKMEDVKQMEKTLNQLTIQREILAERLKKLEEAARLSGITYSEK